MKRYTPHITWLGLLACLLLAFQAQAARFDTGLLWKIESAGHPPSYLFGTMHSDDPRVLQLPAPVKRAFDESGVVGLELELDAETLFYLARALIMTDGTTLESLLGEELYRRTAAALAKNGIPEFLLTNMKPWAAAVTLLTPPTDSGVLLDQQLYQDAVNSGKRVLGLETVQEQLALFEELSQREQIAFLRETLDQLGEIQGMLDAVRDAYLARDLKRLMELNAAPMSGSDPELERKFRQRLIVDRNHRMAQRMLDGLRSGGHFFAVGALHLPGEEGLLNLLSKRGFTVTAVY